MTEPDDALMSALHRAGDVGNGPHVEDALVLVRSRSRVAKRRRATARAVAVAGAVVVVMAVWLASRPTGEARVDTVSSPTVPTVPTTLGSTTRTSPPTTASTSSTTPSTATAPSTATTPSTAMTSTAAPTAGAPPPARTGSAPTTPPSSSPETFRGAGGAVTVRLLAQGLQLVSVQPAAGYQVTKQKVESDQIEIRFEGAAGRTDVVLQLEAGRIVSQVEDKSSSGPGGGDDGSRPGTSDTSNDSGGSGGNGGDGNRSGDGQGGYGSGSAEDLGN